MHDALRAEGPLMDAAMARRPSAGSGQWAAANGGAGAPAPTTMSRDGCSLKLARKRSSEDYCGIAAMLCRSAATRRRSGACAPASRARAVSRRLQGRLRRSALQQPHRRTGAAQAARGRAACAAAACRCHIKHAPQEAGQEARHPGLAAPAPSAAIGRQIGSRDGGKWAGRSQGGGGSAAASAGLLPRSGRPGAAATGQ